MVWSQPQKIKGRCRECGCHLSPSMRLNQGYCVNVRCGEYTYLQPWARAAPEPDEVRQRAAEDGLL